jgi:hypothetical protein
MGTVSQVNKVFARHVLLQSLENAQATDTAVKHADRLFG